MNRVVMTVADGDLGYYVGAKEAENTPVCVLAWRKRPDETPIKLTIIVKYAVAVGIVALD